MWKFLLCDLNGDALADISDVDEREINFRLNRASTLSFKMELGHRAAAHLLNNEHCFVLAYKNDVLRMVAETSTLETVGDSSGHSIAVNCIEAAWIRLAKRYIGQSAEGVLLENYERDNAVAFILAFVNTESDSGVNWGGASITTEVVTAGTWYFKPAIEAITELSVAADGFDFWFDPVAPTAANNYRVGSLLVDNVRGDTKPNAIFEYGAGAHNAREYRWLVDIQNRITQAISLPPTYPSNLGLPIAQEIDTATETTWPGLKRRAEIIQNDLVDFDLRQQLVDEHVAVRKFPRNIFQIQPHVDDGTGRVPTVLEDYDVGDIVEGRVKDSGVLLLDALVRIYGITVKVDKTGIEENTLTVIEE